MTDEIVRLCHRYSFPLFTMPWDTRIFDITHDYYNRIFEDSRDDGNMTAAFQNILMGNSLTRRLASCVLTTESHISSSIMNSQMPCVMSAMPTAITLTTMELH